MLTSLLTDTHIHLLALSTDLTRVSAMALAKYVAEDALWHQS